MGATEGEVPELDVARPRRRLARLDTASRHTFDPVRSAVRCAREVLHYVIREQFLPRETQVVIASDETKLGVACCTLNERIGVSKRDSVLQSMEDLCCLDMEGG